MAHALIFKDTEIEFLTAENEELKWKKMSCRTLPTLKMCIRSSFVKHLDFLKNNNISKWYVKYELNNWGEWCKNEEHYYLVCDPLMNISTLDLIVWFRRVEHPGNTILSIRLSASSDECIQEIKNILQEEYLIFARELDKYMLKTKINQSTNILAIAHRLQSGKDKQELYKFAADKVKTYNEKHLYNHSQYLSDCESYNHYYIHQSCTHNIAQLCNTYMYQAFINGSTGILSDPKVVAMINILKNLNLPHYIFSNEIFNDIIIKCKKMQLNNVQSLKK